MDKEKMFYDYFYDDLMESICDNYYSCYDNEMSISEYIDFISHLAKINIDDYHKDYRKRLDSY